MSTNFTDDSVEPDDMPVNRNINYRNNRYFKTEQQLARKQIHSFYQLLPIERERVMLAFRGGVIRGFKQWQIKDYIYTVTGINVTNKFCLAIRQKDFEENKMWYYNFAKDSRHYLGAYRKAIDTIEILMDELWKIILKPNVDDMAKIAAIRELHNFVKTGVLLLRDLPFIMSLSKYYDLSKLDSEGISLSRLAHQKKSETENGLQLHLEGQYNTKDSNNTSIVTSVLAKAADRDILTSNSQEEGEPQEDDVMKEMQKQLPRNQDTQLQEKMDKELLNNINKDIDSLKQKYETTLLDLDNIISPEHRETLKKLRSLKDV